ncbi:E3 ubiquitin-protein ligase TRIM39-like [Pelobates fuscus]|uniref:E3 ubiquitin-protein ligase TRIM39-like n=1 Tax=Pelobates fuscus TaxID=191477 RepID=UPI002FE444F8
MASAALNAELTCSICLNIYTNPVTLPCGHNFCSSCLTRFWEDDDRECFCPECRHKFWTLPELKKNLRLRNIAENFLSSHQNGEDVGIPCTYCIDSPVPAAKTCLCCEASLCENHLKVHIKSAEHVLVEPNIDYGQNKCSIHHKPLEYYCSDDATLICVYCVAADHRSHLVKLRDEASEKEQLRYFLKKLTSKKEETEIKIRSLHEYRRGIHEKTRGVAKEVTAMIMDIREQLEALEKRVHTEISRQEEQVSLRVSDLIRQLEIKKEDLSREMGHIEELCNMMDPVINRAGFFDTEKHSEEDISIDNIARVAGDLDLRLISVTLNERFSHIVTDLKRRSTLLEATELFLDEETVSVDVELSADKKTATWLEKSRKRPSHPRRFVDYPQVLSTMSFSSGRYYWRVDATRVGNFIIGVSYENIDREGSTSYLGHSRKCWGLSRWENQYSVRHDAKGVQLPYVPSNAGIEMFLDYDAGRISFYELCTPIRHLYTYVTSFTEPLYVIFNLGRESCLRIKS